MKAYARFSTLLYATTLFTLAAFAQDYRATITNKAATRVSKAQNTGDTYLPWEGGAAYYERWSLGPPSDHDYFPIAVWLQSPPNAGRFKDVGVNLFIALYRGTVEKDSAGNPILPLLRQYGMPVFGDQKTGLAGPEGAEHLTDRIIQGWTQMDEPDNAQPNPNGSGYVDCIAPYAVVNLYNQFTATDPNRPVYLNLGQGASFNVGSPYIGRGSTCNQPSRQLNDYPQYIQGADILSNDSYPKNDHHPLWWIGRNVDRLREWANYQKPVWQWIELVNFNNNSAVTLSPDEIKSEVWMTIIHGGSGFGYFVHQFAPVFEEASIFYPEHEDVKNAVAAINGQVTALARVLNTASVANGATVASSNPNAAINFMLKRSGGATFLLAINDLIPQGSTPLFETGLSGGPTTGTFTLRDFPAHATAVVLGEDRQIEIRNGVFQDSFASSYTFHLYEILFDPNPNAPPLGDVNGDGVIDCADLKLVITSIGETAVPGGYLSETGAPGQYNPSVDVVRDGIVDGRDVSLVAQRKTGRCADK